MLEIAKSNEAQWTAARTKPRCEKVVSAYCDHHGIACYLPWRRVAKRYQRRTVVSHLPMFSGYVFVQVSWPDKTVLRNSGKIVSILPMDDTLETVLISELRGLQLLEEAADATELVVRSEIVAGETVTVAAGPLQGLTGMVERRHQKTRVTVNIELLGQSVSADLDIGEVVSTSS